MKPNGAEKVEFNYELPYALSIQWSKTDKIYNNLVGLQQ